MSIPNIPVLEIMKIQAFLQENNARLLFFSVFIYYILLYSNEDETFLVITSCWLSHFEFKVNVQYNKSLKWPNRKKQVLLG